ncbi:NF-kappa-B inhibitor epsilon [Amia ocellicauda]|uniref:NF-kappa-B inhibitor epsilon n=1 Tax=Amia ocellicauda TaxID=2972642 RepID=UPI003464726A
MANTGDERKKAEELSEDNQYDSGFGIDSFKSINQSINQDDQMLKKNPLQEPSSENKKDKLDTAVEERLDSSYGSSSLTVDSIGEILQSCSISVPSDSEAEQELYILSFITDDGDTILHLAVIHEEEEFAHQLISMFTKDVLDIQNDLYQTPLHLATYLNLPSVVRALVQKKASLELQDQDGNTPLHVACDQGRLDCAIEMIRDLPERQLSAIVEIQNWRGLTCLHLATLRRNHRIMKLLLKKGPNINTQEGTSGKTPLHLAVELHDVGLVTLLLNKGANVDAAMYNGCTALHLAVGRQDAAIANLLCQSGADKMLRNMEDETALDLADGNDDILALFPFDDIYISGMSVIGMKF